MIWLSNSTIARLRDQLRDSGRRPSAAASSVEVAAVEHTRSEYGPLCEAMYLMMAADGEVSSDEYDVLRGALRNLSGDSLRAADVEALLERAARAVEAQGRDARLKAVAAEICDDRGRSEVAFVLAAAIDFADNAIADSENETLNTLAEACRSTWPRPGSPGLRRPGSRHEAREGGNLGRSWIKDVRSRESAAIASFAGWRLAARATSCFPFERHMGSSVQSFSSCSSSNSGATRQMERCSPGKPAAYARLSHWRS